MKNITVLLVDDHAIVREGFRRLLEAEADMKVLGEAYPGTVPFDVLRKSSREMIGGDGTDPKIIAEDTQTVAMGLLNCYMSSDLVELHGMPITYAKTPGELPTAWPVARMQAARGGSVTNRRHEVLRLNDLDRHLVPLLDGHSDKTKIIEGLAKVAAAGALNVQKDGITLYDQADIQTALKSVIDQALQQAADKALLV